VNIIRLTILAMLSWALLGCTTLNERNEGLVAARPLEVDDLVKSCNSPTTDETKRECIAEIANDSLAKCTAFLDGLVLTENTVNTAFDLTSTLLSALGAVLTPIKTAQALSAGATVSTGWKNAVNSNIYAKASIANYAQAIQATYYKDIGSYRTSLVSATGNDLSVRLAAANLQIIHRECSLAAAQASIAATLQDAIQPQNGTTSTNLTVQTPLPSAGTRLKLTATSPALGSPVDVQCVVAAGDTDVDIAKKLLDDFNTHPELKAAGISAAATTPASNKLVLSSPATKATTWASSDSKVLALSSAAATSPLPGKSLMAK